MSACRLAAWLCLWTALAGAADLTPAQQQVMRQYQAAELARQDCRTYVKIVTASSRNPSEGPYRMVRAPEKAAEAVRLYADLLARAQAAFGPGHPQVAAVCSGFARLYEDQGTRLDLAEAFYRKALEINQAALGPDSPEAADAWFDLGVFYHGTGRFREAEPCLEDCLRIRSRTPGPQAARAQCALGQLYEDLGDYARAEGLFQEALARQRSASAGLEEARTLTLLADLSARQGDIARCGSLAGEALRLVAGPSGATSGDQFSAKMLALLPEIYQGHWHETAARLYKFFFTLLEQKDWAAYLRELNEYAHPAIVARRGFFVKAMARPLDLAVAQTRQTFGDHHPQLAAALANTALLDLVLERWEHAVPACVQANEINYQNLPAVFAMASERQKLKYVEKTEGYRDLLLSAVVGARAGGAEVSEAFKWALRMKGIVLDSMVGEREVLRRGLDPGLRDTYGQLREARQELSSLYIKGPEADPDGFNARMAQLAGRIEELESRLSQGSAAFKEARERFAATPEAVRAQLPQGSALVEYLEFTNYGVKGNPPWLAAFVLEPGQAPPLLVDLGPSAPAAQAITEWRNELGAFAAGRGTDEQAARGRLDGLGHKVAALLWNPVAERGDLLHKRIVYLAPDGPMHLMPFGPLPSGKGYLIEQVNLAYVSTGKDFLRGRQPSSRSGALLVGGVDFALDLPAAQAPAPETRAGGRPGPLNDLQWPALAGTGQEVDAIAAAMAGASVPATLLKGGQARKAAVSAGFATARYIHLATHGFFLGDELGLDPGSRGIAVLGHRPVDDPRPGELPKAAPAFHRENPLLLSGLVLAGANRPGGGNGDGYLLAMDVANLDLAGVDLVTLSACETGLGEIRRGEGVFGLQRSFVLAGADALVMSLWSVPDQETRDLMVDFYRQILAGGSRREAFRRSQLRMLRSGAAGGARHPYFWAAFQYLGVD